MDFFTRIDFMTLTPGNKSAGFLLAVSTKAVEKLGGVVVSDEDWARLVMDARKRVRNSGLLSDEMVEDCGLERFEGTAVPKSFWVNRMFASSLGADPDWLRYARDPEMSQVMGSEVSYSPHNVDSPVQALVLHIIVQAWCEWAWAQLCVAGRKGGGHDC